MSQQHGPASEAWRLYEDVAFAFARDRNRLIGEERYLRELTAGRGEAPPRVLDLGCGTGVPLARHLIESGCEVTGVDAAPAMIALAGARFPAMRWLVGDMRRLALKQRFDAILAWDSFFHLAADDQRAAFGAAACSVPRRCPLHRLRRSPSPAKRGRNHSSFRQTRRRSGPPCRRPTLRGAESSGICLIRGP